MPVADIPVERILDRILLVRGCKVLLDSDLATLYGVATRTLNQAVKRNLERFPSDFMFRLSARELENWRSQAVMSNPGARMGLRRSPAVFTEHGALMAATVLNSRRAIATSVFVVRAFVRMRQYLATHKELAGRLNAHERKLVSHDQAIAGLVETIRQLAKPSESTSRPIGFVIAAAESSPPPRRSRRATSSRPRGTTARSS